MYITFSSAYIFYGIEKTVSAITNLPVKGNAQFIFLCNPPKPSVNVFLMKILKSIFTKKIIVCFYNLGEENF